MDPMYRYQMLRFYGMKEFSPDSPINPGIKNPHVRATLKRWYARMVQEIINDRNHMVATPLATETNQPQATLMPAATNSIDLTRLYNSSIASSSSGAGITSTSLTSLNSSAPSSTLGDPPSEIPQITARLSRRVKTAIRMLSRGGKLPSLIRAATKEMYGVEISLEEVLNVLGIAA